MKKLSILFTLLLCVCFSKMSAQSEEPEIKIITWALYGDNQLEIYKNGVPQVLGISSGIFEYNYTDVIRFVATGNGVDPILAVICEDNYIGSGPEGYFYQIDYDGYYFTDGVTRQHLDHTYINCGNDVYVEIKS